MALIVQTGLMMAFPAIVLARISEGSKSGIVKAFEFAFFGCVAATIIVMSGEILKDCLIVALLSFIFFLMMIAEQFKGRLLLTFGLLGCAGIALIRSMNSLILLPCFVYAVLISPSKHKRVKTFVLLISAIVTSAVSPTIVRDVFGARKSNPQFSTIIFDVAGISSEAHENLFKQLDSKSVYPEPWTCFTKENSDPFIWGNCKIYDSIFAPRVGDLSRLWLRSIITHPVSYLRHRLKYAAALLDVDGRPQQILIPAPPYFDESSINTQKWVGLLSPSLSRGLALWRPNISFVPLGTIAYAAFASPLGQPWAWICILVGSLTLGLLIDHGLRHILVVSSLLGLSNLLLFIILGPDDTSRYLFPTWFCAAVDASILMLIGGSVLDSKFFKPRGGGAATENTARGYSSSRMP